MNVYRSENAMLLANSVPYWFLKIHIPVCKSSYTCVKSLFKETVMQAAIAIIPPASLPTEFIYTGIFNITKRKWMLLFVQLCLDNVRGRESSLN